MTVAHRRSPAHAAQADNSGDQPRWTDHQVAVLIELAWASGFHRHRISGCDDPRPFRDRCRDRTTWLALSDPLARPDGLWAGIDDDIDVAATAGGGR